ncbi:LacI family DNA-binding transcriptional regulator [Vibrio salinus]|uniref:LacI family DNA-binding transcriptional regulator n=1 Tax=Vibrio salinus TaxID=2899784 RepID=UPI001E5DAD69|nr:LacI family DNA-binding transcriptional regulator [Vibrio salinus]MCE0494487.1 LacI family transcriptional regulator [Vibrio salinus]
MRQTRKRKGSGKVTIADVAKKAGVGSMTVSRALRTPELVSEKLREKIQQVIEELGYIPNKAAGALASGESKMIAVILPSLTDKACSLFLPGFQKKLNQQGYQLLLGYCDYSPELEEKLLSTFMQSRPDAIALFGSQHSETVHNLIASTETPVIEIAEFNNASRYHCIGANHFEIAKACTKHLLHRGCKNVGFIGARDHHSVLQNMLHGWQSALIENYLAPDHFLTAPETASFELGSDGLSKLLLRDPTLDALVCSHEEIALGVLFECQRKLIKVPQDLSIVCLNGSASCEHTYPRLSCARINYSEMGKKAGEQILSLLGGTVSQNMAIDVGFKLYRGSSTHKLEKN